MPQLTIRVHGEVVRQGLQDLRAEIPQIGRLQLYYRAIHIRSRMDQPAPRPAYPINWVSIKQRKAFFATKGFGRGIPSVRTHAYERSWVVVRTDHGYRLENQSEGAKFIGGDAYGEGQSPIHAGRWPLFRAVAEQEIEGLDEDVQKEIRLAIRRHGFGGG
jgi:hypothetical protein